MRSLLGNSTGFEAHWLLVAQYWRFLLAEELAWHSVANCDKPADVWDILPEDTQKRKKHFAAYPEDLCRVPILATSPPNGVVLDPFCGTGTTMYVASRLGRKSVGIDLSREYLEIAEQRTDSLF